MANNKAALTDEEWLIECERIMYEEEWHNETIGELRKGGREFWLSYKEEGLSPQETIDRLSFEGY